MRRIGRVLLQQALQGGRRAAPEVSGAGKGAAAFAAAAGEGVAAAGRRWGLALSAGLGLSMAAAGAQLWSGSGAPAECKAAEPAAPAGDGGAPAPEEQASATEAEEAKPPKTRVVVLGTGWGAITFLKNLNHRAFGPDGWIELVVVSPRSYFLYTPLLPSAAAGSVQERSIMEPVRNLLNGQGTFYQAECTRIDPQRRVLTCSVEACPVCETIEHEGGGKPGTPCAQKSFEVPYDILVVGVGSVNNTFGIKGVGEHCFFLKQINDAHRLRVHIAKVVEHAGLPHLTPEERRRHLNFTVVGGGPTGVELAAEVHDLVKDDVSRLMPHLKGEVSITVIDTMDHLLGAFDRELSEYTASHFQREGIQVQLGTMVRQVGEGTLTVKRSDKEEDETIPFGTCVWATGVAMHPLVRGLKEDLQRQLAEVQNSRTGVVVDSRLQVKGTNGTIFALGDCAVTHQDRAQEDAAALFAAADVNGDGRLSQREVTVVLEKAKKRYPQMGELAAMLEEGVLERAARGVWGQSSKAERYSKRAEHIERLKKGLSFAEFKELLADMDTLMRALPPTAQVAAQEGKYLARLLSTTKLRPLPGAPPARLENRNPTIEAWVPMPDVAPLFVYRHFGAFSYVGSDRAVLSLPSAFPFQALKGWLVGLSWRSFEAWGQVSARNRWMVHSDWLKTKIWGRNVSEA